VRPDPEAGPQVAGLANTAFMGVRRLLRLELHQACAGSAIDGAYYSSPDLSAFDQKDFYTNVFLPAYKTLAGHQPRSRPSTRTRTTRSTCLAARDREGRGPEHATAR
jgi:hypothetical protein